MGRNRERVVSNCWRQAGLLSGSALQDTDTEQASTTNDERDIVEVMSNLVVPDARMSIHALLNTDNVDCHEEVSIGNITDSAELHDTSCTL